MRFVGFFYGFAYLLLLGVMFILPKFSFPEYSLVGNSLSELGAQHAPGNWIMNTIIVLLAVAVVLLASKKLRRFWLPLYLLYFFALSLVLTAIFKHAPIADVEFSIGEHIAHSVFTTITGTAFCVYCITIVFFVNKQLEKATSIFMCALAIGLSLLMFQFSEYKGILQRALFIIAFGWLLYSLVTFTFQKPKKPAT